MIRFRMPAFSVAVVALFAGSLSGVDLSRYREFTFEMDLSAVARQTHMEVSEATTRYERPAMVQELMWRLERFSGSSDTQDPVSEILFSFYNGQLFRMVANYDRQKTEGLREADVIEAISASYGASTNPNADIISSGKYNERRTVLARWEDEKYAYSLVRSPFRETFQLIGVSKRLNTLAEAANVKATQLEEQEAPQRKQKEDEAARVQLEKARTTNKASFRP